VRACVKQTNQVAFSGAQQARRFALVIDGLSLGYALEDHKAQTRTLQPVPHDSANIVAPSIL
jgi:hypothetical protein